MQELGERFYNREDYRELFSIMIDSVMCEDTAIGVANDGQLLYIENKLMNNSSAYWVQSIFYSIDKDEFCAFTDCARSKGYIEKAIKNGKTTEEELKNLSRSCSDN